MVNKDEILSATELYLNEMKANMNRTSEIGRAYLVRLIDLGLSDEEAAELYIEASVALGKDRFGNDTVETTKRFLDMVKED